MIRFVKNQRRCSSPRHLGRRVALALVVGAMWRVAMTMTAAAADGPALPIAIAEVARDEPVNFAGEVLPILRRNCLACHNAQKSEGELSLESPQSMRDGGASGPAIEPGAGVDSLVILRATGAEEPLMPPPGNAAAAQPLSSEELGILKRWIDEGAEGDAAADAADWQPLPAGVNAIFAVAVSPDGQYAACARANQVFVYHVPTGGLVGRLTDPSLIDRGIYEKPGVADLDLVQALAFSPSGDTLALGGFKTVKLFGRAPSIERELTSLAASSIPALAVSPDKRLVAVGGSDGWIKLWNSESGAVERSMDAHAGAVASLAFSVDGQTIYSCSSDSNLRAWRAADGVLTGEATSPAPLRSLTLVRDGVQIAAAGDDGIVRVWALPIESGAADPVQELSGASGPVASLAAVPGSPSQLVAGGDDGAARLWNLDDGQVLRTFDHSGPITAVAIRPDGSRLVTVGRNQIGRLWNLGDGAQVAEFGGDVRRDRAVAAADRRVAAQRLDVAATNATLSAAEGTAKSESENAAKAQESLAAAEKSLVEKADALKTADADKAAAEKLVIDLTAAAQVAEEAKAGAEKALADADAAAKSLAEMSAVAAAAADAAPSNTFLAAAKEQGAKELAAAQDALAAAVAAAESAVKRTTELAEQLRQATEAAAAKVKAAADADQARAAAEKARSSAEQGLAAANAAVERATTSVDAAKQAAAASQEALAARESDLSASRESAAAARRPILAAAFSPDGQKVVTTGEDGCLYTWNAETGEAYDALEAHAAPGRALAFLDEDRVVSGGEDRRTLLSRLTPEWQWRRTIGSPDDSQFADRVTALDFSPDGRLLATGGGEPSRSGELKVWTVDDGSLLREFPDAHSDAVLAVVFSPDGSRIASCGADKFVKVFDAATAERLRSFEGHTHHVLDVAWRSDGRVLASAGADNVVKVWSFDTGEQVRTIGGFGKEITSINFVGATESTVAASGDQTLRLHQTSDGKQVRAFGGSGDFVYSADVTPDGARVVGGGQDSVLRVWNSEDAELLHALPPPQ